MDRLEAIRALKAETRKEYTPKIAKRALSQYLSAYKRKRETQRQAAKAYTIVKDAKIPDRIIADVAQKKTLYSYELTGMFRDMKHTKNDRELTGQSEVIAKKDVDRGRELAIQDVRDTYGSNWELIEIIKEGWFVIKGTQKTLDEY